MATSKNTKTRTLTAEPQRIVRQLTVALRERRGAWAVVAERTGIEQSWLSLFYRGKIAEPGFSKAYRLAKYLGVQL